MPGTLSTIKGVGPAIANRLAEAGFVDLESVAAAKPETLAMVNGIGEKSAVSISAEAKRLVASNRPPAHESGEASNRKKRAKKLRKQAKQLRRQAKLLTQRAKSTTSKKKRKRRLREAAELAEAARRKRRKAKKLLAK